MYGARDPFGIKPLYYTTIGDKVYFASERKSLMAAQNGIDLDTASLQQYMSFQFVPEPSTLDAEVKKSSRAASLRSARKAISRLKHISKRTLSLFSLMKINW